MKAIILQNNAKIETKPLIYTEIVTPDIQSDEILIRIKTCGICHTDLHIVEGDIPLKKSPVIIGHQIIGVIEKIGADVKGFVIGERVGIPWLNSTCGECKYCKSENENLCENAKFTGYDVDGGFAEYTKVNYNFVYKIPENFSDEAAAPLLCAGIIGFRALKISGAKSEGKLGIYGFGASAHLTIQVARYWGTKVYVFSRSEQHRKLAEDLGAEWTGDVSARAPVLLDSIISFAPVGDVVPLALKNLDKGGTLALAGIYTTPIPMFEYNLIYNERSIKSVANSTRQDAIDFLKVAGKIPIQTKYQVFDFEDAQEALKLLKYGKINGAGVLSIG